MKEKVEYRFAFVKTAKDARALISLLNGDEGWGIMNSANDGAGGVQYILARFRIPSPVQGPRGTLDQI